MEEIMATIVYTILFLFSFFLLTRKKEEAESKFPLKLIGYFVIGSIAFTINHLALPIGFVVYLVFFRPKFNVKVKRIATVLGLLTFVIIKWLLPFSTYAWESRLLIIEHELGSAYTIKLQDEYELIKQELSHKNNSLKLEDFVLNYEEDGRITDLRWQLIEQIEDHYNLYKIQYDFNRKSYRIERSQPDNWLQFNRLIEADSFFAVLKGLNMKDITHVKEDTRYYSIKSTGEWGNYGEENLTYFIDANGDMQLIDKQHLPVKGFTISTIAMKKIKEVRDSGGNITEEMFEGNETAQYIFDIEFNENEND